MDSFSIILSKHLVNLEWWELWECVFIFSLLTNNLYIWAAQKPSKSVWQRLKALQSLQSYCWIHKYFVLFFKQYYVFSDFFYYIYISYVTHISSSSPSSMSSSHKSSSSNEKWIPFIMSKASCLPFSQKESKKSLCWVF